MMNIRNPQAVMTQIARIEAKLDAVIALLEKKLSEKETATRKTSNSK